ncbi:MAG: ABC transporter ATP-binding protein, partial [Thermomicrobiales bacterium]
MSAGRPAGASTTTPARPPLFMGPRGGHPGMGGAPVEKARNFRKTLGRLVGYLRPFWLRIAAVLVFAIASTSFAIVSPRILGDVTNMVVSGYSQGRAYDQVRDHLPPGTEIPPGTTGAELLAQVPPDVLEGIPESQRSAISEMDLSARHGIDFDAILRKIQLLVALYLLSAAFGYVQAWIMAGVSQQVTYDLRDGISQKIDRLPLRYFDSRSHGEVLSRVTNDVETISQTLNQSLSQIVTSLTMLIGILAMMIWISWEMTLVAMMIVPVSLVLIRLITQRSQPWFVQQQASLGELNGHVEEM